MTDQIETDQQLLDRFIQGDIRAFDSLVQRYRDAIYRYCLRMIRNDEDALDLTQEVFIKVYRKASGFKGLSSFKTWLYKIATNLTYNKINRRRLLLPLSSIFGKGYPSRVLDEMISDQQTALVQAAIEKLPQKQKKVLILRIYEELSFAEIAEIVGSPIGTVKAHYFHAVKNLQSRLEVEV